MMQFAGELAAITKDAQFIRIPALGRHAVVAVQTFRVIALGALIARRHPCYKRQRAQLLLRRAIPVVVAAAVAVGTLMP